MRTITMLICLLFVLLLSASVVLAHGGVEKYDGNVLVFLNQSPLSPLVGEATNFSFAFSDLRKNTPFKQMAVKLTLSDTYLGDESKDKVVLTKTFVTDVNGDIDWNYTFNKENYFDMDIDFIDPTTGKAGEVGFLVQPRAVTTQSATAILSFSIGILIGLGIAYALRPSQKSAQI